MSHDQTFKELLCAFFEEFLILFYPKVAERLDFSRVRFLDKETFTDVPEGKRRASDLVVEIYTLEGIPEIVLVHIEVEWEWGSDFPARMFDYFSLLRLRYRCVIFPVAVFLTSGRGGLTQEQFTLRAFNRNTSVFTYDVVGLPALKADNYLRVDNPLAPALSALMKPSQSGKVTQKYQSLLAIVRSGVDEARLTLLTNVVETYLELNGTEQASFKALVAASESKEVAMVVSVYEERGIEKGIVRGKRSALLRLMERKFGTVPLDVRNRLEAITEPNDLDRLLDTIFAATSIEEMGL